MCCHRQTPTSWGCMNKASTDNAYRRMPFKLFRALHKHYIVYIFIHMHIYVDAIKAQRKAHPDDPVVTSGERTGMEAARKQEHQRECHFVVVSCFTAICTRT